MHTVLKLDDQLKHLLKVPECVISMAKSFEFLPSQGRFRMFSHEDAVLEPRCHDGHQPAKTFMAMYGSQHEIDQRHLYGNVDCLFISPKLKLHPKER